MRVINSLLILSIILFSCGFCLAAPAESVQQIVFLVEVVVYDEEDCDNLNLDFADIAFDSDRRSIFLLGYDPSTLQVLAGTPFGTLFFSTVKETSRELESCRSQFITVPGKQVEVLVAQRSLSAFAGGSSEDGIRLQITPKRIGDEKDVIVSYSLSSTTEALSISSEIKLEPGVPTAVAIIGRKSEDNGKYFRILGHSREKHAVVYISAFPTAEIPTESLSFSSIEGLIDSLWVIEQREAFSFLRLDLSYEGSPLADLSARAFLGEKFVLDGIHRSIVNSRFGLMLGIYPSKWALRLDAQFEYLYHSTGFFSLGFSDEVEILPGFSVGAAFYPLVFDVVSGKELKPRVSAFADLSCNRFNAFGTIALNETYREMNLSIGLWAIDWLRIFGSYNTDLDNVHRFSIGTEFRFR